MIYENLKIQATAAETENEIADAKTAVLGSEKLISEDEMYELLTLLNAKQDAIEEEQDEQHRQFRADANSEYMFAQTGRR
jgi:methylmalonyl-CoA mutase N-terminal domain/subunit